MEMASGCPIQEQNRIPGKPVRGPHGGWKKQEIDLLQTRIDEAAESGESLRSVFDRIASELGRKPNSIRNFYYAQIRTQEDADGSRTLPFETFSTEEVEQLIERVLVNRAKGLSVRACVRQMAEGDRTRMLRYQNKYRSTLRTRPDLVRRVMDRLQKQGVAYVDPYAAEEETAAHTLPQLRERVGQSGDVRLTQLFSSLDYLIDRALRPQPAPSLPADSEVQRRADRLSARCDMLRIALEDEQMRRRRLHGEAENMVSLIKEYLALPEKERPDHQHDFCRLAAQRLSAMECALMEGDG